MLRYSLIDNPKTSPLLSYSCYPSTFFIATNASMSLFITYSINNFEALLVDPSTEIDIIIPNGSPDAGPVQQAGYLTNQIDNVTFQSLTDGWSCIRMVTSEGVMFKVYPITATQLIPGDSIQIVFNTIAVNNVTGGPVIGVFEAIGSSESSTIVPVVKSPQELAITAWALPDRVGLRQPTTIYWSAFGGSKVFLKSTQYNRSFPWEGNVFNGSCEVSLASDMRQETFTLTAVTDNLANSVTTLVVVNVSPAVIAWFSASTNGPIDINQHVSLLWNVIYATKVFLTTPRGDRQVDPSELTGYEVSPLELLKIQDPNAKQVAYQLRAEGYGLDRPSKTQVITFHPARILSFTYADEACTIVQAPKLLNAVSSVIEPVGQAQRLTVQGPGGPLVQFLGPGPYLEVMYFKATPATIAPGATATLTWIVQNAVSLQLMPGNLTVTYDSAGKGTYNVSPMQTTDYTLVATGQNGSQVSSLLTVTVG